jgi:hypothetical protein
VLWLLAVFGNDHVRDETAHNDQTGPRTLTVLTRRATPANRQLGVIARHQRASRRTLAVVVKHAERTVHTQPIDSPGRGDALDALAAVASRNDVPARLLDRLSYSKQVKTITAVASNPRTPTDILARLAGVTVGKYTVHEALAGNPACPSDILTLLARTDWPGARRRAARHPNTTNDILLVLQADLWAETSEQAHQTLEQRLAQTELGGDELAVACGLLDGWNGTFDELVSTAQAVVALDV